MVPHTQDASEGGSRIDTSHMTTPAQVGPAEEKKPELNPAHMAARILQAEQKLNTHDLGKMLGVKRGKDGTPIYPGDIEERLQLFMQNAEIKSDVN